VIGTAATEDRAHEVRAVLWVLPAGTSISETADTDDGASPRHAAKLDGNRDLFIECADEDLAAVLTTRWRSPRSRRRAESRRCARAAPLRPVRK
jgi:hypothetical protein